MMQVSMVDAVLIANVVAGDEAEAQRNERQRFGTRFEQRIMGEIDGASPMGDSLREQAKYASAATRALLATAPEVAAAAAHSALPIPQAAPTSPGRSRAIDAARQQVASAPGLAPG